MTSMDISFNECAQRPQERGHCSFDSPPMPSITFGSASSEDSQVRQTKQKTKLQIFPRRKAGQRQKEQKSGTAVVLTLDVLQSLSNYPLVAAAKKLGISKTSLKTASRCLGLPRWPFRRQGQGDCSMTADSNDNKDGSEADSGLESTSASLTSSKSTVRQESSTSEDGGESEKQDEAPATSKFDGDHNDLSWMSENWPDAPKESEAITAAHAPAATKDKKRGRETEAASTPPAWDSDCADLYPLYVRDFSPTLSALKDAPRSQSVLQQILHELSQGAASAHARPAKAAKRNS